MNISRPRWRSRRGAGVPESRYEYTGVFPDITHTRGVYKPIIAAMHSHVVGYAMWIALDADIRIAAEDVSFWLPEPQWVSILQTSSCSRSDSRVSVMQSA